MTDNVMPMQCECETIREQGDNITATKTTDVWAEAMIDGEQRTAVVVGEGAAALA